jgi:hypothetical protein
MERQELHMLEGFALYRFLPDLAAYRVGRKIREPALMTRHGEKI